jgi:RNA-directed DNA polymerase
MLMERRGTQNLTRKRCSRPTLSGGSAGLQANFQLEGSLNSWMRIGLAAQDKDKIFTNLFDHFRVENLRQAFHALDGSKAKGIDGISKQQYAENLDANLYDLQDRLHRGTYRPISKKEVLIPKANGKTRPIAISSFEDKIVEWVLAKLLELVYEPKFIRNSFGFRPNKSAHSAIRASYMILKDDKRSNVVEIDLANFFNTVPHKELMKIVQMRIKDRRMSGLIARFLKCGIVRQGRYEVSTVGTPQGGVMSPILANIYLNHVLDQWFIKNFASQETQMVRYADDAIFMFSKKEEAVQFEAELAKRFKKYKLKLNMEKTKQVNFKEDEGNIFHFLGFTFFWSKRKVKRRSALRIKTENEKLKRKLQDFKIWIKYARNRMKTRELLKIVAAKLRGHYNYYGLQDNRARLSHYYFEVIKSLHKWLNRRSQRKSISWEKLKRMLEHNPLPRPPEYSRLKRLDGRNTYAW